MQSGYVLDFSDRTFGDFFCTEVGIDPDAAPGSWLFSAYGTSKAKRLRSFIARAQPHLVARTLRALWEYRENNVLGGSGAREERLKEVYFKIVGKFEGEEHTIDATGIEAFEANETLQELVAAIRRDLDAGRPNAGLDRLHTYCMKRFASLVIKHGGEPCGENDALHARVGKYVKALRAERSLTEMSERIIKSSISTFEAMNSIRNNQSFAHDKEALVPMEEAKFIYDSVTALLRFIKAVDAQKFED
ncbi:hypothetical protein GKC28_13785 [Leisingera sp. ANG59]|nr:hypothetical protein [Leisingera sp. ANG59]